MTFSVALEYLKKGKKVKRTSWQSCNSIQLIDENCIRVEYKFLSTIPLSSLSIQDILANDWTLVEGIKGDKS